MLRLRELLAGVGVCLALALSGDARAQEPPRGPTTVGQATGVALQPALSIDGTTYSTVQSALTALKDRSTGGHTVEDEGSALTARSSLNFVGSAITCADSGGKTVCTVTSGSGDVTGGSTSTVDDLVVYSATGGKTIGNSSSGAVRIRPTANGTRLIFTEDSDVGSDYITMGFLNAVNLNTTKDCTFDTSGSIPAICIGQGVLSIDNSPTLGANLDGGTNDIFNVGTVSADSFETTVSATVGQQLTLHEASDDGTAQWGIKVPDSGLTGDTDYTFELSATGKIPLTALGSLSNGATPVANNVAVYGDTSGQVLTNSKLSVNDNVASIVSGTADGRMRLYQDSDVSSNYIGFKATNDSTALTSSIEIPAAAVARAVASTFARGPVQGGVSNAGTLSTCTELCNLMYTSAAGVTVAPVTGSCREYTGTADDATADDFELIGTTAEVANGVYFEGVCNVY